MKFQKKIEWMHRLMDGQAQSNMHIQLFQSWGHKKCLSSRPQKMKINHEMCTK